MVSNSLRITEGELLGRLARIRDTMADDPDYGALRSTLPQDWPM